MNFSSGSNTQISSNSFATDTKFTHAFVKIFFFRSYDKVVDLFGFSNCCLAIVNCKNLMMSTFNQRLQWWRTSKYSTCCSVQNL